ncbi:MAG TPA: nitroreductase family protein [Gallionellaceae bacterium]|nr:nitroreductase family protein [Gallionellaceae bacterium]
MNQRSMQHPDNRILKNIYARHSVRAYAPATVDDETVQTLLDAAVHAPTAMHEEPWAFVVVQTPALLLRASDLAKPIFVEEVRHRNAHGTSHSFDHFTRADFNIFHDANTLIIICAKPLGQFVVADCWLAAENLMLAAQAIGLGSCVIGSAVAALNIHKIKTELGIPDEYAAIAPIVIGVPSGESRASSRKEPLILSWKK